jgi:uncharacterized protein
LRYRTLGRTGFQVSEIGFGGAGAGLPNYLRSWDPASGDNESTVIAAIHRALECGINYFDTAAAYGSEPVFGRALKEHRSEVFIATKCRGNTADDVRQSVEDSLRRLGTDYVDLIQHHGEWYGDEDVEQFLARGGLLDGLRAVRASGLTRFIGFTSEGANGAVSRLIGTGAFDVMQIQYNLLFQHPYDPSKRAGVMVEAEAQGMGIAVMRPFTAGTFQRWLRSVAPGIEQQFDVHGALLSFVLSNPLTDVAIAGIRSPDRVDANCAIVEAISTRLDLDALYGRFLRTLPDSGQEVWELNKR